MKLYKQAQPLGGVAGVVSPSGKSRGIVGIISPFLLPHPQAEAIFGTWHGHCSHATLSPLPTHSQAAGFPPGFVFAACRSLGQAASSRELWLLDEHHRLPHTAHWGWDTWHRVGWSSCIESSGSDLAAV